MRIAQESWDKETMLDNNSRELAVRAGGDAEILHSGTARQVFPAAVQARLLFPLRQNRRLQHSSCIGFCCRVRHMRLPAYMRAVVDDAALRGLSSAFWLREGSREAQSSR